MKYVFWLLVIVAIFSWVKLLVYQFTHVDETNTRILVNNLVWYTIGFLSFISAMVIYKLKK